MARFSVSGMARCTREAFPQPFVDVRPFEGGLLRCLKFFIFYFFLLL